MKFVSKCIVVLFAPFATAAPAVETCPENGNDRDEVLGKFVLGGVCVVCFHDDFCAVRFENRLEEIVCKAAKSVFVGNTHAS